MTVTGDIDQLRISKTLDKEYSIYLDEDADVKTLFSNGDARIVVDGEITKAYLTSGCGKIDPQKPTAKWTRFMQRMRTVSKVF